MDRVQQHLADMGPEFPSDLAAHFRRASVDLLQLSRSGADVYRELLTRIDQLPPLATATPASALADHVDHDGDTATTRTRYAMGEMGCAVRPLGSAPKRDPLCTSPARAVGARRVTTRASDKRRKTLETLEQQEQQLGAAMALVASLERDPAAWRRLQHEHLRRFPKASCATCAAPVCLQCGVASWHRGASCVEHLRHLATTTTSEELRSSLSWQLENRSVVCAGVVLRVAWTRTRLRGSLTGSER